MSLSCLVISGWSVIALLMLLLWVVQYKTKNAGIVDIAWAFATALLGIYFILANDSGYFSRQILLAIIISCWGLRLGIHIARRVFFEEEDGRYRYLRGKLGANTQPFMFVFFQIQALWALLFALPLWAAARAPTPELYWLDLAGVLVWLAAFSGESIADLQLQHFRENPANKGSVCQHGLWRYSRHPNYFFEWLQWWAYVLIGYGSDVWWITWCGVALMLVFLVKVTGIPYTEQQSVRSRGQAYRDYQKTTSVFIPMPPKLNQGN